MGKWARLNKGGQVCCWKIERLEDLRTIKTLVERRNFNLIICYNYHYCRHHHSLIFIIIKIRGSITMVLPVSGEGTVRTLRLPHFILASPYCGHHILDETMQVRSGSRWLSSLWRQIPYWAWKGITDRTEHNFLLSGLDPPPVQVFVPLTPKDSLIIPHNIFAGLSFISQGWNAKVVLRCSSLSLSPDFLPKEVITKTLNGWSFLIDDASKGGTMSITVRTMVPFLLHKNSSVSSHSLVVPPHNCVLRIHDSGYCTTEFLLKIFFFLFH